MDDSAGLRAASDGDLARRVASRDGGAAEAECELCARLARRVRLYGLRHLRDAAAADDLVQDVLVLTLERLRSGRVRDPDRLASFVLGACRLVVWNDRRGRSRRGALLERFPEAFARRVEPDGLLLDVARLRECLARLAERERSVVVLTFYAEESSGAIAERLGLTTENVRTVRHRAFVRLRRCVNGGDA